MLPNKLYRVLIMVVGIFLMGNAYGQIKIGDNATTIEPRALLELESSSKAL